MQESLPLTQAAHKLIRGRRNIGGVLQRAARCADPVLAPTELAGGGMFTPDSMHQLLVNFSHQPQRQGQGTETLDPVLQCHHVVADLLQVVRTAFNRCPGIRCKQFAQRGLSSFDTAGEHRLSFQERSYQQMWIGQPMPFGGQLSDETIGI